MIAIHRSTLLFWQPLSGAGPGSAVISKNHRLNTFLMSCLEISFFTWGDEQLRSGRCFVDPSSQLSKAPPPSFIPCSGKHQAWAVARLGMWRRRTGTAGFPQVPGESCCGIGKPVKKRIHALKDGQIMLVSTPLLLCSCTSLQ